MHKDGHDVEGAVGGGHGHVHEVLGVAGLVLADDGVGPGPRTAQRRAGSGAEGSMRLVLPSLGRGRSQLLGRAKGLSKGSGWERSGTRALAAPQWVFNQPTPRSGGWVLALYLWDSAFARLFDLFFQLK